MPTTPNEKPTSPELSTEPAETLEPDATGNLDLPDNASEVAKRLNLLGKLIIPPASQ